MHWVVWSESQCDLVSDASLCVCILCWHMIGLSPSKSMTQWNNSLAWGISEAISNTKLIGSWSNYRLLRLQDVWGQVWDRLIACNRWPECYQEHNVFTPHCRNPTLYSGAMGACPRDHDITPRGASWQYTGSVVPRNGGDIIHNISFQRHRRRS
jgi:hypothetical protein